MQTNKTDKHNKKTNKPTGNNKGKHSKFVQITSLLLVILMVLGLFSTIVANADEIKTVTIGADLTDEQREQILDYFNIDEKDVVVVDVTNKDEHKYLDGIASKQQIGTHTYSCSYIQPTESGGINIKTVNLTYVTCEMIRNALVTSGITDCNVVCASPIEVSGTGALTGIFKAYEQLDIEGMTDEKVKLASEELVLSSQIGEVIGKEESSKLIEELMVASIENKDNKENLDAEIEKCLGKRTTEEQRKKLSKQFTKLSKLMNKVSEQDYNLEDIVDSYKSTEEKAMELKKEYEANMTFIEKVKHFIVTIFKKITGQYDEKEELEGYVNKVIGIVAGVDESELSKDALVTDTGLDEAKHEAIDKIKDIIKSMQSNSLDDSDNSTQKPKEIEGDNFLEKAVNFLKGLFLPETKQESTK